MGWCIGTGCMAKVQSGSMLGGRLSSRYSPGRATVVGEDECNT